MDIVVRLRALAEIVDDTEIMEIEEALLEAAEAIEGLRDIVDLQLHFLLKVVKPAVSAYGVGFGPTEA